jgi:hypothetical protein
MFLGSEWLDENPRQRQGKEEQEDPAPFLNQTAQPGDKRLPRISLEPTKNGQCQQRVGEQKGQEPEMEAPLSEG